MSIATLILILVVALPLLMMLTHRGGGGMSGCGMGHDQLRNPSPDPIRPSDETGETRHHRKGCC